MNTIAPVKTRFKTLAAAQDEIEKLERQVVVLNAELAASKTTAAAKTQTPALPSAPAAVNQPPAAAAPSAVKPIDQMNSGELIAACDSAAAAGNHQEANRFYRAYSERKSNR
jgi:hypothetical protein